MTEQAPGVMRFANIESSFEMALALKDAPTAQSDGDAYVTVQIQSLGFVGHNDLWVSLAELAQFAAELHALALHLRGEAKLRSMSRDELVLRVFAVNRRGHLAIEGSTGYWTWDSDTQRFWHAVLSCLPPEIRR